MDAESPQHRLGRLIRERREELGINVWTQKYVADLAGVAQTTISAWENGKRQNPRAVELSRVATSLSAHRSVTTVDDATSRKELLWQEIRATAGKDKSPQHALPEMRRRSSEEERLAANRKVAGSSPAVGISDDHIVTRPHGED